MTMLLLAIIWAHLGFVVTLGIASRRRVVGRSRGWRRLLGVLAAGPLIWLLTLGTLLRSKPCRMRGISFQS
ncbi:hypothetical protein [Halomonas sp. WWR20]